MRVGVNSRFDSDMLWETNLGHRPNSMKSNQRRQVKSEQSVETILQAAHELLAFEGYPSFTMRNIADRAGISVGNVQYYFRSKNILLQELLVYITEGYNREYRRVLSKTENTPDAKFGALVDFMLTDMTEPLRRGAFFQTWALAPNNEFIEKCMEESFIFYRTAIADLISELVPGLRKTEREKRASAILALIDGAQLSLIKKEGRYIYRAGMRALVKKEAVNIAMEVVG
jgi:AcrR family transcriptional regulator